MGYVRPVPCGQYREKARIEIVRFSTEIGVNPFCGGCGIEQSTGGADTVTQLNVPLSG